MKTTNYYSSWDFINSYNDKRSQGELLKHEKSLEDQYSLLIKNSKKSYYKSDFIIQDNYKTPVESFLSYFELGLYPPPSVFAAISESFNHYEQRKGEITLEEAFFGAPSKSIGNESSKKARLDPLKYMYLLLNDETKQLTQIEAADITIEEFNLKCEVDSFIRKYSRFKKKHELKDIKDIKDNSKNESY